MELKNLFIVALCILFSIKVNANPELTINYNNNETNSWKQLSPALANVTVTAFAIDPVNPNNMYAGSLGQGLFITRDGKNWSSNNTQFLDSVIVKIVIDPTQNSHLFMITEKKDRVDRNIYQSIDYGQTWRPVKVIYHDEKETKTPPIDPLSLDFNPVFTNEMYSGDSWGRFLKSYDRGETWIMTTHDVLELGRAIYTVAVNPKKPREIYAGVVNFSDRPLIYKSIDAGATWTPIEYVFAGPDRGSNMSGIRSIVIDPNKGTIYAFLESWEKGFAQVFKSTDDGKNWERIATIENTPSIVDAIIDPTNNNIIYALTRDTWLFRHSYSKNVLISYDGGRTWINFNNGLPKQSTNSLTFHLGKTKQLYAGLDKNGVYTITSP